MSFLYKSFWVSSQLIATMVMNEYHAVNIFFPAFQYYFLPCHREFVLFSFSFFFCGMTLFILENENETFFVVVVVVNEKKRKEEKLFFLFSFKFLIFRNKVTKKKEKCHQLWLNWKGNERCEKTQDVELIYNFLFYFYDGKSLCFCWLM